MPLLDEAHGLLFVLEEHVDEHALLPHVVGCAVFCVGELKVERCSLFFLY